MRTLTVNEVEAVGGGPLPVVALWACRVLIGAVAIASFSVHLALTMNTTWVKDFLNGSAKRVAAAPAAEAPAPRK